MPSIRRAGLAGHMSHVPLMSKHGIRVRYQDFRYTSVGSASPSCVWKRMGASSLCIGVIAARLILVLVVGVLSIVVVVGVISERASP